MSIFELSDISIICDAIDNIVSNYIISLFADFFND